MSIRAQERCLSAVADPDDPEEAVAFALGAGIGPVHEQDPDRPLFDAKCVVSLGGTLINSTIVIPAKAGIQRNQQHGLFVALTLRAALWAFNALRAFVPLSRE